MYSIVLIIHTLLAVSIVILVLMQQSGSGAGALGGGGASQSFFGSRGSFSLLMKVTAVCAGIFFVTSIGLSIIAGKQLGLDINTGVIRQQQNLQQQQSGSDLPSFEEQEQELKQLEEENLPVFEEPNTESGN